MFAALYFPLWFWKCEMLKFADTKLYFSWAGGEGIWWKRGGSMYFLHLRLLFHYLNLMHVKVSEWVWVKNVFAISSGWLGGWLVWAPLCNLIVCRKIYNALIALMCGKGGERNTNHVLLLFNIWPTVDGSRSHYCHLNTSSISSSGKLETVCEIQIQIMIVWRMFSCLTTGDVTSSKFNVK